MDIERLKRKALIKYPLFGSILAKVKFVINKEVITAGTDGENIYYNPSFLESLSIDQQLFVIIHEICHIAFDHISRSKGKDKRIWNLATDSVVNAYLKKEGLTLIEGAVDIEDAINYDSEEMYKVLYEEIPHLEKEITNQENHSVSNHSFWETKDLKKDQSLTEEIKKMSELGEKEAFNKNKIIRKKALDELREDLASKSHGSSLNNIKDIGKSTAFVNWKMLLKENVNQEIDWSYKNAQVEDGVVTPYLEEISSFETEIILDTSGSVDERLLRSFLKECKNILNSSKIKIGCFNTKFYGFTEIRQESDIDSYIFPIGGGTDFKVAITSFTKNATNKIIFTDGMAIMPNITSDIIWIVYSDVKINPKGGKVIYISSSQLDELYDNYKKEKRR